MVVAALAQGPNPRAGGGAAGRRCEDRGVLLPAGVVGRDRGVGAHVLTVNGGRQRRTVEAVGQWRGQILSSRCGSAGRLRRRGAQRAGAPASARRSGSGADGRGEAVQRWSATATRRDGDTPAGTAGATQWRLQGGRCGAGAAPPLPLRPNHLTRHYEIRGTG